MNGWISVKDRLPEDSDILVLVIVNGDPKNNIHLIGAYEIASYSKDDGWIIEEYAEWENPDVTHWMPIPEPPEEE